jgi:hypothetical protein
LKNYLSNILILFLFINQFFYCSTPEQKKNNNLFLSCMETFADEEKCNQFLEKVQVKKQNKNPSNSTTEKLFIRDELKNLLDTKSKLYVLELLGEPDEKSSDGSGREFYKYLKPIARYSPMHDPDSEIIIIFKRGIVTKVTHKKSDTTP